jgi:hypothetical protein
MLLLRFSGVLHCMFLNIFTKFVGIFFIIKQLLLKLMQQNVVCVCVCVCVRACVRHSVCMVHVHALVHVRAENNLRSHLDEQGCLCTYKYYSIVP